ncbi:amino acid adenylation domain-containing protein [Streptomyces sp. NPDC045251]|uniref:amino acid adenylation domain-containing protein n=1 Tax=unclassified Streptomyces TaxID=2593676 RepID=UPI0033DBC29E
MRAPALVHERFAARAAAHPDALAVVYGDQRVSYGELDRRSERLAQSLRRRGVLPGGVVMVHLERSVDLIVSFLATLKAGAMYLPVEPGTPRHRLLSCAEEACCTAVLTRRGTVDLFAGSSAAVVAVQGDPADEDPASPVPSAVDGTDGAYIIYTSGSSGAPKGVRVDHAPLARLCEEINTRYGIGPGDRVLQMAAVSFDTSIEQILVTLLHGAALVLPDQLWAPSDFADRLTAHGVTVMDLTPSYWRAFLSELERAPADPAIRLTIVGGSAVHAEDCRRALRLMPRSRLVNAYGLTETTITSCTMEVTPETVPEHGPVPVGRPLPGTLVHVLDDELRPVPPGRRGEVCLSGAGVAHGYLGRNADHSRFLPDPHARRPGTRMYRTGDIGGWTDTGDLEITGRVDRQLKIRGFRVEPAEIEAALSAHAGVVDAAVVPWTRGEDTTIAAYYTAAAAARPSAGELRSFLGDLLPRHMIPAAFVHLPGMPMTDRGKIDLKALPAPDATAAPAPDDQRPDPRPDQGAGLVERVVAGIWGQVLDVDRVGPHDNFFSLGGDSLKAAQLLARLRESLGILITQIRPLIRLLLDDATLRGFAVAVASARAGLLTEDARPVDFAAEAVLGLPVPRTPAEPASWQRPAHAFLTGATGFLGVYLLRELLTTTGATVHCLVRSADENSAMARIQANAVHYLQDDLEHYRAQGRIRAVRGDLTRPLLGLPEHEFDRLAAIVDVIHHPGGLVNFLYPYAYMRAANVEGTREIVRLATRHRNAPVHYTSTMATISGFGTAGIRQVDETTAADHADRLSVGYVESKWVAEALLLDAARQGLPVAIYRAADISGDRRTGAWNTSTEMCAMKRFIVDTEMAPVAALPLDYTPVDSFAAAVAHIAATRLPRGDVYHLTNPGKVNVSALTERLRAHGHKVREVPWDTWVERIAQLAIEQPEHPMTPFAPLFIDRCSTGEMSVAEMYLETTFPVFSRHNVESALGGSGIEIPPVDTEMLDRYIRYLTSVDFL